MMTTYLTERTKSPGQVVLSLTRNMPGLFPAKMVSVVARSREPWYHLEHSETETQREEHGKRSFKPMERDGGREGELRPSPRISGITASHTHIMPAHTNVQKHQFYQIEDTPHAPPI